jgi:hypothetical protein
MAGVARWTLGVVAAVAAIAAGREPVARAAAPAYAPVFRTQCLALERLTAADRAVAEEWLTSALDREGLYTIGGGLKPVSSGARTFQFKADTPALDDIDQARRIAAVLNCGGLSVVVHLFSAASGPDRYAELMFVHQPALDRLLDEKRAFFAPLGLSPGAPPLQVLGVVEHLPRAERFRGLGYLFGFPDYAVDFFVTTTVPGKTDVGPGKDRDFYSVPVHRAGSNYFVWAVPIGHHETDVDRAIARRAAPILEAYRTRRARFVGEGLPGVVELLRDWLCDESGMCGADRAVSRLTVAPRDPSEPLTRARQLLRDGRATDAAAILQALDAATLGEEGARRLRLMSEDAAIRTGDAAWLARVNARPERYTFANGYLILTAWGYLRAADTATARHYLSRVKAPERMEDRERRRYHALQARIAQLERKPAEELRHLDWMIAHQAKWATPACQQCHDNRERFGAEITSFPLATWWAGERYSASLQSTGRAARIAAAATRRLDAAPDDADARLRLAYARRALGDVAGMEQALRALPWAAFPDRTYREPRDLLQFP